MDDTVSRTSQDSAADEFVVVTTEPKLHIAGNGCALELERKMTEVLTDDSCAANSNQSEMAATLQDEKLISSVEEQQSAEPTVADANDASDTDRRASGNSFNNLNTSTNATAGQGA